MTFTPTPPTEPGAYWWKLDATGQAYLVDVIKMDDGKLTGYTGIGDSDYDDVAEAGGLWSARLVPSDEVEKLREEVKRLKEEVGKAWWEGRHGYVDLHNQTRLDVYEQSRASKVAEGGEI